ncbi:hypothetical protein BKA83DRAFT_4177274 [Pisolithus microcarpus]|nr:hypothetical protein BKA83DRAFT_4177274 [Pisolithus microcarpus]
MPQLPRPGLFLFVCYSTYFLARLRSSAWFGSSHASYVTSRPPSCAPVSSVSLSYMASVRYSQALSPGSLTL